MRKILLLLILAVSMCVGSAYASDVGASPPTQFVTEQNYVIVPQFANVNVFVTTDVVQPVQMHNLIVPNLAVTYEKIQWYAFADRHRRTCRTNDVVNKMYNNTYKYNSYISVQLETDIGSSTHLKHPITT